MKKRSVWIAVLLLCVWACLLTVACKKDEKEVLATPQNLKIENEYLTWDEVENATGYTVDINNELYETEENSLDIFLLTTEVKTYEMKVVSMGDGEDTIDSDWSETIEYTLTSFEFQGRKTQDGTGYEIRANNKSQLKGKVTFPSEIDGLPITKIVRDGFVDCTGIESVILPDTIVELGANAFSGCTSLKRMYLSDELESIGGECFKDCTALMELEIPAFVSKITTGIFRNCNSLTNIQVDEDNPTYRSEGNCIIEKDGDVLFRGFKTSVIPESVKKIGSSAFNCCNGLTKITVPGNVKKVGYMAFSQCQDLQKVIFEEGVRCLGIEYAFADQLIFAECSSLQSVTIPSTVEWIAIDLMKELLDNDIIELSKNNQTYAIDGNCLIRKKDNALVRVGKQFVIPNYVTKIETLACFKATLPKTMVLPATITEIGANAFGTSTGLERIILPEGLQKIASQTFMNCKELQFVSIPNTVTEIRSQAFYGCSSLTQLLIPNNVQSIGERAFYNCSSLTQLLIPKSVQSIGQEAFKYAKDVFSSAIITVYTEQDTIPAGWVDFAKKPIEMQTSIMYGCTFGEDEGIPYVKSWKRPVLDVSEGVYLSYNMYPLHREGYTFKGWSLAADSNEIFIGLTEFEGETVMDLIPLPQKFKDLPVGTVLYAVWEKNA